MTVASYNKEVQRNSKAIRNPRWAGTASFYEVQDGKAIPAVVQKEGLGLDHCPTLLP